jgi:hypothetical protein
VFYQRLFNFSTLSQPGAVTAAYLTSTLFVTLPLYSLYSFIRHKSIKAKQEPKRRSIQTSGGDTKLLEQINCPTPSDMRRHRLDHRWLCPFTVNSLLLFPILVPSKSSV